MLKPLKIEGNLNVPDITFDAESGKLWMKGRSIVENAVRFYEPVVNWVKEYCNSPAELTEFHIQFEYFNTSTSKYILSIVEQLQELYSGGNEVVLYWYSADEDMEELGEDYAAMLDIPFKFLEYSLQ